MQDEHKQAIQRNFASLVERTDLDYMVSALYEKGVFSVTMIEKYKDTNLGPRDLKRKLFNDITRRGPHAFEHLLEVLVEDGQWDLVRDLDENSMLHPNRDPRPPLPRPQNNFLSISTEKHKTKVNFNQPSNKDTPSTSSVPRTLLPNNITNDKPVADPVATIPHFQVKKSTKFIEEDDSRDIKLYRTRGRNRGILLVFSYTEFSNDEYRSGVDVDCTNLKYLFDELGFHVLSYQNLKKEETINTLRSMKDVVQPDVESVFVVVSSHGYKVAGSADTDIRCSDGGLISLYDIIECFNNRNLPLHADIPKVFVFQICRGSEEDFVWSSAPHLQIPDVELDGRPSSPAGGGRPARSGPARRSLAGDKDYALDQQNKKSLYSNILIANSTLPGFVSYRDVSRGSWYIQTMCDVFAARAHDCHVDKLFTLVDQALQARFRVQTSSVDRWGFNRRLYLHPGLYN